MAVTAKQLNHVGFSPNQAAALEDLAGQTVTTLVTAGFTSTQAKLLKAGSLTLAKLINHGKFSKAKATLILAL